MSFGCIRMHRSSQGTIPESTQNEGILLTQDGGAFLTHEGSVSLTQDGGASVNQDEHMSVTQDVCITVTQDECVSLTQDENVLVTRDGNVSLTDTDCSFDLCPARVVPPRPPENLSRLMSSVDTDNTTSDFEALDLARRRVVMEAEMLKNNWANAVGTVLLNCVPVMNLHCIRILSFLPFVPNQCTVLSYSLTIIYMQKIVLDIKVDR